jgi:ABC-type phosphate/phosphonate transport system substrate-binding protein
MLASLPMYDLPEIRDYTDAFWAALAKVYGVAGGLHRSGEWSAPWRDPNLIFSQTCGYPFTHEFAGQLKYVATPHYAVDGCVGANYCSLIFARTLEPLSAFEGRVAAINSTDSMSGMLALKLVFAPLAKQGKFFSSTYLSGGHAASLAALQNGTADLCACDCVTAALLRKYQPQALEGLVEIARSPIVPGLPFVTRLGDVQRLREALASVMENKNSAHIKTAMLLSDVSVLSDTAYDVIPKLEHDVASSSPLNFF